MNHAVKYVVKLSVNAIVRYKEEGMKKYAAIVKAVSIKRYEIEAENAEDAKEQAYEAFEDDCGIEWDSVDVMRIEEAEQ